MKLPVQNQGTQYVKVRNCDVHFTAMASVTLIHIEDRTTISIRQAINKCSLFENNPALAASPYQVQSPGSLLTFREFVSALEGNPIKITDTNFTGLEQLSREFGFSEIAGKLSEFRPLMDFKEPEDANARGRIAALEKKANQRSQDIAVLQDKITQLSTDFGCF
jgi:hypothetical protein